MSITREMITTEMIEAAETLFVAMAFTETIRPTVTAIQVKNMANMGYSHLKPGDSYIMPKHLWPELHERNYNDCNAAGLTVEDPAFCPLLVAEHNVTKAQHNLIEIMQPLTNISHEMLFRNGDGCKTYYKYIDLNLRLLAPFVRNADTIMEDIAA